MEDSPLKVFLEQGRERERRENIELAYQLYQESKRQELYALNDDERLFWTSIACAYATFAMKLQAKDVIQNPLTTESNLTIDNRSNCLVCKTDLIEHVMSFDFQGIVVAGVYVEGNFQVCLHTKLMRSHSDLLQQVWRTIRLRDQQIDTLQKEVNSWKIGTKKF